MPPVSEQGSAIQWTRLRKLSELRKSTKFYLYNQNRINQEYTNQLPYTIAIAVRITRSNTNIQSYISGAIGSILFRYYLDIIRYPGYPWIGLLSARPDRIIYPPQVCLDSGVCTQTTYSTGPDGLRDIRCSTQKKLWSSIARENIYRVTHIRQRARSRCRAQRGAALIDCFECSGYCGWISEIEVGYGN